MKFLIGLLFASVAIFAQEGMWTFDAIPMDELGVSSEWVEHVQKATLRLHFGHGGTGSFVSKEGLLMTNHHVASKMIYDLSTQDENLMEKGFYAKSLDEEKKCSGAMAYQLIEIVDVTQQVQSAVREGMDVQQRKIARKEAMEKIKNGAEERSGLKAQIVSLYRGWKYHLYLYKTYEDIRLVMAPEKGIAFFGGDERNFEFPRHDLDVTFFRVYENGKPLNPEHFFSWNKKGGNEGETLFVPGNPGRTERLLTASHLRLNRDVIYPLVCNYIDEKITLLKDFSSHSEENERIALDSLFSFENAAKVYHRLYEGLCEKGIIEEREKRIGESAPLDAVLGEVKESYSQFFTLERGISWAKPFHLARLLYRYAEESKKESQNRLPEYADSELDNLKKAILTEEPIYRELEVLHLEHALEFAKKIQPNLPGFDVKKLLATSKIADLDFRKHLFEHPEEIAALEDPLFDCVKTIESFVRPLREKYENIEVELEECYAKIAKTGAMSYPDATFTLRLSAGEIKGYDDGESFIEPMTTLGEAYSEPYPLPESWMQKADAIDPHVPFNFVTTHDIVGGNSGSPMINRNLEVVGLIFDGNRESLLGDFFYDEEKQRAVSVHSGAIMEALDKVYETKRLIEELSPAVPSSLDAAHR